MASILATQITALPLPSTASGFVGFFDPALGTNSASLQSLGPILSERAETIGKNKVLFGFGYQRFRFDTLDGEELQDIPGVLTHSKGENRPYETDVVTTSTDFVLNMDQITGFVTYGLNDRIDVSVAVPIMRSYVRADSTATLHLAPGSSSDEHYFDPANPSQNQKLFSSTGSATGIGDILLRVKGTASRWEWGGLALAADLRLPTGDEEKLLGSGALGIRPFAAFSFPLQHFTPHFNVGYQWNGESVLGGDIITGTKGDMPDLFTYAFGTDVGVTRSLTLALDLFGTRVIDSNRLVIGQFTEFPGLTSTGDADLQPASFNMHNAGLGFKFSPAGSFLVNFNVLVALDDNGLRDKVTPLLGVMYRLD